MRKFIKWCDLCKTGSVAVVVAKAPGVALVVACGLWCQTELSSPHGNKSIQVGETTGGLVHAFHSSMIHAVIPKRCLTQCNTRLP